MPEQTMQAGNSPTAAESQNKPTPQPEATLQDVIDTMHESDIFPRTGRDAPSRFWSAYERVAKQHDDEFIERHNGDMDVLLIFAGLFSAVGSAFIVNMQPGLSPVASDTTNSLLKILINKIDNSTFPAQEAALSVWTGPSSTTIWIQSLAYASLSSSLLAAFGAVLGKQWLGHFKTSRFGRGSLHERCERRQKKLDALEASHFSTIISSLPIFLQISLLFFGIALAANIWTLQQTIASVIMATTAFGFIFYFFTVVSSLKSPDSPFQTPVSTLLQHILPDTAAIRALIERIWDERPKSWEDFLDSMRKSTRCVLGAAKDLIAKSIGFFVAYLSRAPPASRLVHSLATDSEAAVNSDQSGAAGDVQVAPAATEEQAEWLEELHSGFLKLPVEMDQIYAVQSSAVQWILETSTDIEIIAAAAGMVPETEWLPEGDVTGVVDRLKGHLYACFDPTRRILPLAQAGAVACLKAMRHLSIERNLERQFSTFPYGELHSEDDHYLYHMLQDQAYLIVSCSVATGWLDDEMDTAPLSLLDTRSLPLSDRMWMAHMFAYRLHKGEQIPEFVAFVIDFIGICLDSKPPPRLVADCLLLTGMLIGLPIDRPHLAKLDKSIVIRTLRELVLNRAFVVLVDEKHRSHQNALKLIHPLLPDFETDCNNSFRGPAMSERAVKLCFYLLKEDSGTVGKSQVRSNSVAILIRLISRNRGVFLDGPPPHTLEQFDLLVDYHLQICEGTDVDAVRTTFQLLEWLGGSPNTPDRMRHYIDTTIRFMGQEATSNAALTAACSVRSTVASMGRDEESLREDFSKALASVVLLDATQTPLDDNPFTKRSFFYEYRDWPYLRLLCALSQEPTWHSLLHQNGHFSNCLAMAKTLPLGVGYYRYHKYDVLVAHVLSIIDAPGEEHPFFIEVQAYPFWPLILRAWRQLFKYRFYEERWAELFLELSIPECLAALPPLVASARKRWDKREETGRLIGLVEQVCHKLDEEKEQRERGGSQHTQEDSTFGHRGIPVLSEQICKVLDVLEGKV